LFAFTCRWVEILSDGDARERCTSTLAARPPFPFADFDPLHPDPGDAPGGRAVPHRRASANFRTIAISATLFRVTDCVL
jgi:hypothetical protein